MYFLLDACQHPTILRVLYFAYLFWEILAVVIPIGLIIMLMVDFTKAVVISKENEQVKSMKLVSKRIMYAVLIFATPWLVSLVMTTLDGVGVELGGDYMQCITTVKNIANGTENIEKYDKLLEEEEEEERLKYAASRSFNNQTDLIKANYSANYDNLQQCTDSRWSSYPVCLKSKTICSSGCGYMAYTMVVRHFGYTNITPPNIVDIACNEYGYTGSAASIQFLTSGILNNRYGIKVRVIANSYDASPPSKINENKKYLSTMKKGLREGKAYIILQPGHYLSILGINNDDTIIVGDSGRGYGSTNKYTLESFYEATKNSPNNDCETSCGWTFIGEYSK